jgi:quinol monooxygenase YgiN
MSVHNTKAQKNIITATENFFSAKTLQRHVTTPKQQYCTENVK